MVKLPRVQRWAGLLLVALGVVPGTCLLVRARADARGRLAEPGLEGLRQQAGRWMQEIAGAAEPPKRRGFSPALC